MENFTCKEIILNDTNCIVIYNKDTDKLIISYITSNGDSICKVDSTLYNEGKIRQKLNLRPNIKLYKPLTKEEILKLDKGYYLVDDDGYFYCLELYQEKTQNMNIFYDNEFCRIPLSYRVRANINKELYDIFLEKQNYIAALEKKQYEELSFAKTDFINFISRLCESQNLN